MAVVFFGVCRSIDSGSGGSHIAFCTFPCAHSSTHLRHILYLPDQRVFILIDPIVYLKRGGGGGEGSRRRPAAALFKRVCFECLEIC